MPAAALLVLAACASGPQPASGPAEREQARTASHVPSASGGAGDASRETSGGAPAEAGSTSPGGVGSAGTSAGAANAAVTVPPPPRAVADFERAVTLMKAGNVEEAELGFEQVATTYPHLAAPDIDLGILYRKAGDLDRSERALREAVDRDAGSAVAWSELGVTLRMLGKFHDAEDAYQRAIAADPSFAPAYRNLGVLRDLYLGDAPGALEALERYEALTGEKEPVKGWVAELRRRAGKSPAGHGPAAAAAGSKSGD